MPEMPPEAAAKLRAPFPPEAVGKLPRVTCKDCRDRKGNCDKHQRAKCRECGNYITTSHLHLDYVGHAEITDRLLMVDPAWTWEPVAFGQDGLPAMGHGGLWIRLTVAGVTRLGFGHADGKTGPDSIKEAIGDALRNAAMRFGVGLDLWGATYKGGGDFGTHGQEDQEEPAPAAPAVDPEVTLLVDAFMDEVSKAKTDEDIAAVGKSVKAAKDNGELPKFAYDQLARAAAAKKAELNGAEK